MFPETNQVTYTSGSGSATNTAGPLTMPKTTKKGWVISSIGAYKMYENGSYEERIYGEGITNFRTCDFYNQYSRFRQGINMKMKNTQEEASGSPRLENYLKKMIQNYADKVNADIKSFIEAGNHLPYDYIRLEYGIANSFVPEQAIISSGADPSTLRLIEREGVKGVDAVYLRLAKMYHMTEESRKVIETQDPSIPADKREWREQLIHHTMIPIQDGMNYLKAKYRLIEDVVFMFTSMGMEYYELQMMDAQQKKMDMQRQDLRDKVKEVEQMFTVTKGGQDE
jgi:hypothetical protein